MISLLEGPSEEARMILQQLSHDAVPVMIVLTKNDLVSAARREEVKSQVASLASEFGVSLGDSPFSS